MFNRITILGPGLLGASLLQAAKQRGLCRRTAAWSRRPETRLKCEGQPWCDAVFEDMGKAVAQADLVVVCTPVDTIVPLLREIAPHLRPRTLVTDVGSTKSLICRHGRAALPEKVAFVGSHPMAGSEKAGLEHADPELFQGRACFVTPLVGTPGADVERVVRFWKALGMEVATTTPEAHDEIAAHLSHLPHLLASAYCAYLSTRNPEWIHFAGPGLRDTTRVAAGDPALWHAIAVENREEILRSLEGFQRELDHLRAALHNAQPFALQHLLERGRDYRIRLRPLGDQPKEIQHEKRPAPVKPKNSQPKKPHSKHPKAAPKPAKPASKHKKTVVKSKKTPAKHSKAAPKNKKPPVKRPKPTAKPRKRK